MKTTRRTFLEGAGLTAIAAALPRGAFAQPAPAADGLATSFAAPPQVARPRVWWHWMNGNVTQEGIKADLAWMKRVGIGGAHYFDAGAALANYKFITPRLVVGDDNWKAAVKVAATTADSLGLELTTAASPGWSETGGPWVTPAQAMKKYVWSETEITGGRPFKGRLAAPPTVAGPFQDQARDPTLFGSPTPAGAFYADALVVAYRIPKGELPAGLPAPKLTASGGATDLSPLTDGGVGRKVQIVAANDKDLPWIQAGFDKPQTVRGVAFGIEGLGASSGPVKPQLLVSDDGQAWRVGATLDGPARALLKSYGFAPLTARFFRLTLPRPVPPMALSGIPAAPPPKGPQKITVSEFALMGAGVVDRFVEKAGFGEPIDYAAAPSAAVEPAAVIGKTDVIDLTARMAPDGALDWTPPRGRWRVLRLGYSLTGQPNAPAPPEATGFEVDKFSPRHIQAYLDAYLGRFEAALGKDLMGQRGLQNLLTDSWEAGSQNWTDDMAAEFRTRRGYDLTPWLPVLTGRVVESAEASDKFLWDFRRTLQDLMSQHYALIAAELKRRGMGFYAEAQGDNWRMMADGMEIKRHADIPMAEYWQRRFGAGPGQPTLKTDMKESASVAHVYGKALVANESLTVFAPRDMWGFSPAMLRPVVDEIFAYGVNRIVIHTSVHQPRMDKGPGLSLGPFGQFLTRTETWAEQAGPFLDYISRGSHLLQQGRFVADVAYFYGEDRPLVALFDGAYDEAADRYLIEVPEGHGFDFVNAEALREELSVEGGLLTTRSGMRYRLLYMRPDVTALTLPTLHKLKVLVEAGAVLVGAPPSKALGLTATDEEIRAVSAAIWGEAPVESGSRTVGAGRVRWGLSLAEALKAEAIAPDVALTGAADLNVVSLHRRTDDGADIYYLSNRKDRREACEAGFRVSGKTAELWRADDGSITPLSFRQEGGRTIVPLDLGPLESAFVVFRHPAAGPAFTAPARTLSPLAGVDGPWKLAFPAQQGPAQTLSVDGLASWSDNADPALRYFSGTAAYSRVLKVPKGWLKPGARLVLDLGEVKEIAEVSVNGKAMGTAWKPPYRVDITEALKPGDNQLVVKVTNLWANRLIGDAQPGVKQKVTWTGMDELPPGDLVRLIAGWQANAKLLPSGLLGPVSLLKMEPG